MPHCTKCGAAVADNAGFCGNCGAAQPGSGGGTPGPSSGNPGAHSGLAENVAGTVCYTLGWVTGLIFFFIDKRPFVQFHARQSIVVFGGLGILSTILGLMNGTAMLVGGAIGFSPKSLLFQVVNLLGFILWIVLMIKAYKGEKYRVPVAADLADSLFGKM
jgi:uncharacterized membrane protein